MISDTVHNFFVSEGVIEGTKKNVLPKKTPIKAKENVDKVKEQDTTEKKEDPKQETPDSGEDDKTAPKSE